MTTLNHTPPNARYPTPPPSYATNPPQPPSYVSDIVSVADGEIAHRLRQLELPASPQSPNVNSWDDSRPIPDTHVTIEPRYRDSWEHNSYLLLITSEILLLVYYRVYAPAGVVKVKNPEFSEDPYLGRTLVIHITPPHSAANIKRHLTSWENIADSTHTGLFHDLACRSAAEDAELMDIIDPVGPGSVTAGDPVALVISEVLNPPVATPSANASPQNAAPPVPKLPRFLGGIPRRRGFDYKIRGNHNCTVNNKYSTMFATSDCCSISYTRHSRMLRCQRWANLLHRWQNRDWWSL
jgi:hypothetical protein